LTAIPCNVAALYSYPAEAQQLPYFLATIKVWSPTLAPNDMGPPESHYYGPMFGVVCAPPAFFFKSFFPCLFWIDKNLLDRKKPRNRHPLTVTNAMRIHTHKQDPPADVTANCTDFATANPGSWCEGFVSGMVYTNKSLPMPVLEAVARTKLAQVRLATTPCKVAAYRWVGGGRARARFHFLVVDVVVRC
jgi:hypothetical protein